MWNGPGSAAHHSATLRAAPGTRRSQFRSSPARPDGEVIGARFGRAIVGIVPPFAEVIGEAVAAHRGVERVAPAALLGGDGRAGEIAFDVEAIEGGAHVDA